MPHCLGHSLCTEIIIAKLMTLNNPLVSGNAPVIADVQGLHFGDKFPTTKPSLGGGGEVSYYFFHYDFVALHSMWRIFLKG